MARIRIGILGATGTVGQRFIQLLENHPWFEVAELAASERSAGKPYSEVVEGRWKISSDVPQGSRKLIVKECKPDLDCKIVFSALDAEIAGPIEESFARAGYFVISKAKNHRMDPDVPLVIPEVNADHFKLIAVQQKSRNWKGAIVTDPNCSTIHVVLALKPLAKFGLRKMIVTTMQALSGAGYPGVPSMDIIDNVVPYIGGEEEKMQSEPLKLLGQFDGARVKPAEMVISAHCNRVHVSDGHTECVSVQFDKKAEIPDIVAAFNEFNPLKGLNLPSAPEKPVLVRDEPNRPQPRVDRDTGKGMSSVVGRLRKCPVLDYKFVVLGHNTIRGAAGAAILDAEYLKSQGYV